MIKHSLCIQSEEEPQSRRLDPLPSAWKSVLTLFCPLKLIFAVLLFWNLFPPSDSILALLFLNSFSFLSFIYIYIYIIIDIFLKKLALQLFLEWERLRIFHFTQVHGLNKNSPTNWLKKIWRFYIGFWEKRLEGVNNLFTVWLIC